MDILPRKKSIFLKEQYGDNENELKNRLYSLFYRSNKLVRAYLANVEYEQDFDDSFTVALCLKIDDGDNATFLEDIVEIFKSLFNGKESLDIVFLSEFQEISLRNVCCPFFTSENFQFPMPDFFLFSSEGYNLNFPIACFKRKRLQGKNSDGYLLCDIKPSLIGQSYGLGANDIDQLIFSTRHENCSVFSSYQWPIYVHVTILLKDIANDEYIVGNETEHIAWAELYKNLNDIPKIKL